MYGSKFDMMYVMFTWFMVIESGVFDPQEELYKISTIIKRSSSKFGTIKIFHNHHRTHTAAQMVFSSEGYIRISNLCIFLFLGIHVVLSIHLFVWYLVVYVINV